MKNTKHHPIYGTLSLDTTNPDMKKTLVITKTGELFKFNSLQENHILTENIEYAWSSWEAFDKYLELLPTGKELTKKFHLELFSKDAPAKSNRTIETTAIWLKWMSTAQDRSVTAQAPKDPTTGRKSTIGNRIYTVLPLPATGAALKTPQATTCLKIITEESKPSQVMERSPEGKNIEVTRNTITETDLKIKIIERAAELKTRQDPWRIFQYYRPQLISAKLIKHN